MPLLIGIGSKKKDMGPPPKPGKSKGRPGAALIIAGGGPPPPPMSKKPMAPPEAPLSDDAAAASGDQKAEKSEVGFHDGSEVCTNCVHMDPDSNQCNRWNFDIGDNPSGSWCKAYKAGGSDEEANPNEAEPDNDMDDMQQAA